MKKLWNRSEIWFSVLMIVLYVVGNSNLDRLSDTLGIEMVLTLPFDILLLTLFFSFIRRNGLSAYYGLCAPMATAREMLYYLPLLLISTVNIWFGFVPNKQPLEGLVYFLAMIATGLVEEILFRGFLFRAMSKDNLRSAVILTSLLFGLGHIVNLFNGSGAGTFETVCQIFYAISIGFLFAAVLLKGKSLIPCMTSHAMFNALSLFANEPMHEKYQIPIALSLCVLSAAAAVYYLKTARLEERAET